MVLSNTALNLTAFWWETQDTGLNHTNTHTHAGTHTHKEENGFKEALCSLGEKNQTQNFNIYDINEVITQTV